MCMHVYEQRIADGVSGDGDGHDLSIYLSLSLSLSLYMYMCIYIYIQIPREFKDVMFEDVVFDHSSVYLILYLYFT